MCRRSRNSRNCHWRRRGSFNRYRRRLRNSAHWTFCRRRRDRGWRRSHNCCFRRCNGSSFRSWGVDARHDRLCFRRKVRNRGPSRRGSDSSVLLRDRLQHVARLGNMGQVNLGLDLVGISAGGARGLRRRCLRFSTSTEMRAHLFRLVLLNGTGMCLLLGDTDFQENIENGFTLNFQLPGQIVDSNLGHPPFLSSAPVPLSLHVNLTDSVSIPRRLETTRGNFLFFFFLFGNFVPRIVFGERLPGMICLCSDFFADSSFRLLCLI